MFTKTAETDLLTVRTGLLLLYALIINDFIPAHWIGALFEVKFKSMKNHYKSKKFPFFFKLSRDS